MPNDRWNSMVEEAVRRIGDNLGIHSFKKAALVSELILHDLARKVEREARLDELDFLLGRDGLPLIPGDQSGTECWRACMDRIQERHAELEANTYA